MTMRRLAPAASLITALLRVSALRAEVAGFYRAVTPENGPHSPFQLARSKMRGEGTMRETIQIVAIGLLLLASASPALAAAEQTAEPAAGWQFDVMPYAWIPGMFGSVQVKGRTADIDATIGDVLTVLWHGDAFTVSGYFAARYDRWSAFVDAYGGS